MDDFKKGEYISYDRTGICRITDILERDLGAGQRAYYALNAVSDPRLQIYVPVGSPLAQKNMRHIPDAAAINAAIDDAEQGCVWIEDPKERAGKWSAVISEGDRLEILRVFKQLATYRQSLSAEKKKLYVSDARLLSDAETIITEEFGFSLGIPASQVIPYILRRLGKET